MANEYTGALLFAGAGALFIGLLYKAVSDNDKVIRETKLNQARANLRKTIDTKNRLIVNSKASKNDIITLNKEILKYKGIINICERSLGYEISYPDIDKEIELLNKIEKEELRVYTLNEFLIPISSK